jgi:hypothetical protein
MIRIISKAIHTVRFYYFFAFVFALFSFSFFVQASSYESISCHTFTKVGETSATYGEPINLFSKFLEPLITVTCNGRESSYVEVGSGKSTQLIYKYGYRKVKGKWTKTTFSGSSSIGSWIIGKAEATVEGLQSGSSGKILAYVCQKVQNEWKCGCSDEVCAEQKWQLQEYKLPLDAINSFEIDTSTQGGDGELDVHYPTSYLGLPSEKIILYGSGFEKGPLSSVLWNGEVQESGLSSPNGAILTITIPSLPSGKYAVKVKEGNTTSKYGVNLWIGTGEELPTPTISHISPESGFQGGTFTIYGEGFTKENDIISTFGVLSGLPSEDGKSITFTYDPFDEKLVNYNKDAIRTEYAMPVKVTVMNTSGQSNMKEFKLNI